MEPHYAYAAEVTLREFIYLGARKILLLSMVYPSSLMLSLIAGVRGVIAGATLVRGNGGPCSGNPPVTVVDRHARPGGWIRL